jgi:aminomethyltransferase
MSESPASGAAPAPLKRTPLYEFHVAHGARMFGFNGWEMPRDYGSSIAEHKAVRENVGLFDVSHMGILTVEGDHASALLSRRTTANVDHILPGHCRYTFWLNSEGFILDDLLITRIDDGVTAPRRYLVVPNAGRADRIVDLLDQHRRPDTTITRHNGAVAILAVQGPRSRALLESTFGWSLKALKFYTGRAFPFPPRTDGEGRLGLRVPADLAEEAWVSRTGYTGELGYELFLSAKRAPEVAETLVRGGASPCGLVARDLLRLEKGYLLSGHEFALDHTPIEAGQDKFVELDHPFVGREVIEGQHTKGPERRLVGIEIRENGAIPREGMPITKEGAPMGLVTSGGLSPSLGYGIALAYLPAPLTPPDTTVDLELRGRTVPGKVVALPFLRAARA